jgi:hypothetical protein
VNTYLKKIHLSAVLSTLVWASTYAGASLGSDSIAVDTAAAQKTAKTTSNDPGDTTSGYIRDYLSDPRRSGSLAGSILGGAMVAHPAGPIIGSVVGFFIGKKSMFNEEKSREMKASLLYAKRDIVPQYGQGSSAPTLSFTGSQGITFDSLSPVNASQVAVSGTASSTAPSLPNFSSAQIAAACGGKAFLAPKFRSLCFYSQGS